MVDHTLHPIHEKHDLAQGCKAESGQADGAAGRGWEFPSLHSLTTARAMSGCWEGRVALADFLARLPLIPIFLPEDKHRILECFGLKGTLKTYFNSPATGRDSFHQTRLH